jgi:hypothetical protein
MLTEMQKRWLHSRGVERIRLRLCHRRLFGGRLTFFVEDADTGSRMGVLSFTDDEFWGRR